MIRAGESRLNKGKQRKIKGGVLSLVLIGCTWGGTSLLLSVLSHEAKICLETILIFFCLAGTTLIKEVEKVFDALDISLEKGRRQVARIVGRDTTELSEQEVKKAALETLSENLSDGVIAPLFWLMLLGVPGMMAYKMINTLDSMIGYRTVRYKDFGCVAARIDDAANWLPARLTACLILMGCPLSFNFFSALENVLGRTLSPNVLLLPCPPQPQQRMARSGLGMLARLSLWRRTQLSWRVDRKTVYR